MTSNCLDFQRKDRKCQYWQSFCLLFLTGWVQINKFWPLFLMPEITQILCRTELWRGTPGEAVVRSASRINLCLSLSQKSKWHLNLVLSKPLEIDQSELKQNGKAGFQPLLLPPDLLLSEWVMFFILFSFSTRCPSQPQISEILILIS